MVLLDDARKFSGGRSVVALGMFDGVHLGHRALLLETVHIARIENIRSVCFTFDRHPLELLDPPRAPKALLTREARREKIARLGVEVLIEQPFTHAFASLSPEGFIEFLHAALHPHTVVAGYNYSFGENGRGTAEALTALGNSWGFNVRIIEPVCANGAPVSSTAIRLLIEAGDMEGAQAYL